MTKKHTQRYVRCLTSQRHEQQVLLHFQDNDDVVVRYDNEAQVYRRPGAYVMRVKVAGDFLLLTYVVCASVYVVSIFTKAPE